MSDIFNNRELAIILWLTLILLLLSFKKGILNSYVEILEAFFQDKIITSILISIIYVEMIILVLVILNFWEIDDLKDTVLWYIGSAFLLLLGSNKALKENDYFKKIFWNSFKLIVLLEFITNLYTLELIWELILIPILFFFAVLDVFAGLKEEHKIVKLLTQSILTIFGVSIFVFSLTQISLDYNGFMNTETFRIFMIPIILTLAFIPFLYGYVLYMKYENLYLRIGWRFKKKDAEFKKIKKRIFIECNLNLRKLEKLEKINSFNHIMNYSDLNKTLNEL